MSAVKPRSAAILWSGVIIGVVGDALLRAPGAPGLNMALVIASVGLATLTLHRISRLSLDRDRGAWLLIGVAFGGLLAWRAAPPLKLLALGSAALAFALPALHTTGAWLRRAGIAEYLGAATGAAIHAGVGGALVLADTARSVPKDEPGRITRWRRAFGVVRGVAIAVPFLVVFGALFMSADAVFADLVMETLRFDVEQLMSHVLLFGFCAWVATGYVHGSLTGTSIKTLPELPARPRIGITEAATALALLDSLFLLFVIVQFRYLFGGDALVQVTPDLTYSEYARRGFFELVAAVTLVGPILLAADWLLQRAGRRDDYVFRSLAGIQIVLVFAIVASALQRMRLYYQAYGLTDDRFYATALLILIGMLLIWFSVTVLRGRRRSFAFGALVAGCTAVALLHIVNPDAIVARTNLARVSVPDSGATLDVAYMTSLSADAVPPLLLGLSALPKAEQCQLARHILRRWPPEKELDLRSWNWSVSRAHAAVRQRAAELRGMAGVGDECAA